MKALKGLKVIPRKRHINCKCGLPGQFSLMLVPGILTVWWSCCWISDKSAHKFSQTLSSQQDKSSLYLG